MSPKTGGQQYLSISGSCQILEIEAASECRARLFSRQMGWALLPPNFRYIVTLTNSFDANWSPVLKCLICGLHKEWCCSNTRSWFERGEFWGEGSWVLATKRSGRIKEASHLPTSPQELLGLLKHCRSCNGNIWFKQLLRGRKEGRWFGDLILWRTCHIVPKSSAGPRGPHRDHPLTQ